MGTEGWVFWRMEVISYLERRILPVKKQGHRYLIGVQETKVEGEAKQSTEEFSQKGKKKIALIGRLFWNEGKALGKLGTTKKCLSTIKNESGKDLRGLG